MSEEPEVILSGFADEAAYQKTAVQQFAAMSALGFHYYSLRFVDVGGGVKNVLQLSKSEIQAVRHLEDEYGMNVASIGSPIGKVKLQDIDDGTRNDFVPFKKYLERDVKKACEMAHAFETKLIRGFSFYPPKGSPPEEHLSQVVEQLGEIAEVCLRSDLTFGVEVEANLVGRTGQLLAEIHRRIDHPALVLIFDGANILCQGYSPAELFEQYLAMKPAIGWMHVKDYRHPPGAVRQQGHVDEEAIKHFVPIDQGESAFETILKDFRPQLPKLAQKLQRRGIPGVFLDLEPHLKGGGQFGGTSGPDGMGVALQALRKVLDFAGIKHRQRDFEDIRAARGY